MSDDLSLLVALLPWLVAHPGVSAAEAAAEFGIDTKHLLRLVEVLTLTGPGQFGGELIEISYGEADDAITVRDPQRFDRPLTLNGRQASALLAGVAFLREMPALADSNEAEQLMSKLQKALHPVAVVDVVTSEQERATATLLKEAMQKSVCVDIVYVSGSASVGTKRRIEPQLLDVQGDRTFVRAWCHEAQDKRTFRVDRIASVELTEQPIQARLAAEDFEQDRSDWIDATLEMSWEFLSEVDLDCGANKCTGTGAGRSHCLLGPQLGLVWNSDG